MQNQNQHEDSGPPLKITVEVVREADRRKITGLSRVEWWRREREGTVPRRIHLGVNSVGWLRHELERWVADRASERPEAS